MSELERGKLASAFIVADRSIYQLDQMLTILGGEAPEVEALLKQVRDGFDHFRCTMRDHLSTAHSAGREGKS